MIYETERLIISNAHKAPESWFVDQEVCKWNSWGRLTNKVPGDINPNINILWAVWLKTKTENGFNHNIHIGNVMLANINWIDRKAEFSCIFGEKDYWGKGYATEAIRILFDHGFNKLNLNRIWLGTPLDNIGMITIADKLRMRQEGILTEDMFLEGEYVSVARYGVTKYQWGNK